LIEQAESKPQILVGCQIDYDVGVGSVQMKWSEEGSGKDISVKQK